MTKYYKAIVAFLLTFIMLISVLFCSFSAASAVEAETEATAAESTEMPADNGEETVVDLCDDIQDIPTEESSQVTVDETEASAALSQEPADGGAEPLEPASEPTQEALIVESTQLAAQRTEKELAPVAANTATDDTPEKATEKPAKTTEKTAETLKLKKTSATVYRGNYFQVVAISNASVSFKSSNTALATVNSKGVVTARKKGTVTITARTKTKSATCKIKIVTGSSVNLSHKNVTVNRFLTYMVRSTTSGVRWTSSDPSVAAVTSKCGYGFIRGVSSGTAVITAYTSKGAATCLVTVKPARAVRFAYASPNCAAKNQKVTLICITDTQRTAVRFAVKIGTKTKYVNATSHKKDGDTFVWKGTMSFKAAGTYQVKAYAQYNHRTVWSSSKDGETTVFVANSTDAVSRVCTRRRASDQLIKLIATFEGYFASTYIDSFTGDPTLGYGVLVFPGESFYNDLTKNEAYALLVHHINDIGYADDVNDFLINNKIKFNQQQFDALVCFVYNCGTGTLAYDDELIDALLDCRKKGVRDFNYIKKQTFINKLCQYHHAGGGCVYGLLYRRVDETEIFFYGDYHADYGDYRYPIKFTCARNSYFHT